VSTVLRLLRYLRNYIRWVVLAFICMLGMVAAQFAVPWFIRYIIDVAIKEGRHHLLAPLALGVVGVTIAQGVFVFGRRYASAYIGQRAVYDIRNQLYRHLQYLPFSYYDQAQTGQIMSRATQDVETLRRFLGFGAVNIVRNAIMALGVLAMLFCIDWKMTLLVLVVLPPLVFTVRQFSRRVRPAYRRMQDQLAELTSVLQENVTGVRVVRAFAREEHEEEKFSRQNWLYLERNIETVRLWAFFFPLMNLVTGLGTAIILWFGGRQVITGSLSVGWMVAFYYYMVMLLGPLRMLGWLLNLFERAVASGERVFDILDTQSDISVSPEAVELPAVQGLVQFDDVWFRYDDSSPWVLKGVNLEVQPGQLVALLGATGSGKTTIINLIPRFYDPTRGSVRIDGHDLRDLTLSSLRRQIGIVLQDTFLFSASIRENIAYGRPDATEEEIEAAAQAARIHDFIASLPRGYDTEVGERGIGLSGGQKQRVAIARALLLDPPILILDDATSSVDNETEHMIQEALSVLMKNRTTFIIAQRLSTIKNADQIVVLQEGELVQRGTHEDLLREDGIYREIFTLQFGEVAAGGSPACTHHNG